ncbi:MAG: hypothetical protein GY856_08210 [bacterium]|nr:hypothetical protein [bacterium]
MNVLPEDAFNGIDAETGQYLPSPFDPESRGTLYDGSLHPAAKREYRWVQERGERYPSRLPVDGVDPQKLSSSGWGVIFAPGLENRQEIERQLAPLLALRQEQAGDLYRSYEFEAGWTKYDFLYTHNGTIAGPVVPRKMPYYLLIVGDPRSIPFRFQYELDVEYAVGRIHFDDLEDYGRYASHVAAAERGEVARRPSRSTAFFGVERENDPATTLMSRGLIRPLMERLSEPDQETNPNPWDQIPLLADDAMKENLIALLHSQSIPGLLFTASHGATFQTPAMQNRYQGALVCQDWPGPSAEKRTVDRKHYFSADDVRDDANLQGLVALIYACYSAGTPQLSNFDHPVFAPTRELAPEPFVSALAKKLLRQGALAVAGHVERSWNSFFSWKTDGDQVQVVDSTLRRLLQGHRVGYAMEFVNHRHAELAVELNDRWGDREQLVKYSQKQFKRLWRATNDTRNFVIIGDPAVYIATEPTAARRDKSAFCDQSVGPCRSIEHDHLEEILKGLRTREPVSPSVSPAGAVRALRQRMEE